jgi:hypothetical protein
MSKRPLSGHKERDDRDPRGRGGDGADALTRALASAAVDALAEAGGPALKRLLAGRRPGPGRLLRGAAAGAGAAGLLLLTRWIRGEALDTARILDTVLGGTTRGVIYTAVVDPLLPGSPVVKGAVVGTAEYLASPWGGVLGALVDVSPVARLPLVRQLMDAGDSEEDPFVAYLLFGLALAILSGDAGGGGDRDGGR